MTLTIDQAREIVLKSLPEGTTIESQIRYEEMYLFIAYRPDPLEGRFLPFFSVDPNTGEFSDFSPQDYDNPVEVITALDKAGV